MSIYNFIYDPQKKSKQEKKYIYLEIYFGKNTRKLISTKIRVLPKHWSSTEQKIIFHPDALELNFELTKIREKFKKIEKECAAKEIEYNADIINELTQVTPKPKVIEPVFTDWMYKAICSLQTDKAPSTIKDHKKTYKKFNRLFPELKFKDLNFEIVNKYNTWLLQNGYKDSTIASEHKNIKTYINMAAKYGIYEYPAVNHPYTHFKVVRGKGNRCFLTATELATLELVPLPSYLDHYRDFFLFMCYTGLRISDFMRIEKSMLENDMLVLRPQKTDKFGTEVRLPIKELFNGKPFTIWEKYNFEFPNKTGGFDLRMNKNLKLIAEHAGIKKILTCHVARHSFLTYLATKTGNVLKVMKLGGLRKMDTAMIYIHLAEQDSRDFVKGIVWD